MKLVIVLGASNQINNALARLKRDPVFVGGYRVTDGVALAAAMEAAGGIRMAVEAFLSKVQLHVTRKLGCLL